MNYLSLAVIAWIRFNSIQFVSFRSGAFRHRRLQNISSRLPFTSLSETEAEAGAKTKAQTNEGFNYQRELAGLSSLILNPISNWQTGKPHKTRKTRKTQLLS